MLAGNHEDRIHRYLNDRPELAGTYSLESLGFAEFGWRAVPFLIHVRLDGIHYVHFVANSMGNAVSSKHLGANILTRTMASVVVGHSHRFSLHMEHGARKFGLSAGCYFEHEEGYAPPTANEDWWRGLVVLHDVKDGYGRIEQIPLEEVKRRYA